jgi:hypothetical protein
MILSIVADSQKREELPLIKSVNFTEILSLIDKNLKIHMLLKSKKVEDYIEYLAKEESLKRSDYICTVGVGRGAKTFIDERIAIYLLSEISTKFRFYTINQVITE